MPAASHIEKDGTLHQHPAPAPVARQGGRAAGRRPLGAVVHAPPGQAGDGPLRRLRRPQGLAAQEPQLGLPGGRGDRRAAAPRPCCKEIGGYEVETGRPLSGFTELDGRRLHRLRLLDLLGLLRRRRQPAAPARPRRHRRAGRLGGARVGLGLAGQPPPPLQPRLGRPGGQPVVGAQELRLVGPRAGSGPATTCPTSRPTSRPTTARPTTPPERTRSAATSRSSCRPDGRAWLYAPNGLKDGPLPAHYEPHESPCENPLYARRSNPARQGSTGPATGCPCGPPPAHGLPLRDHHLPPDRAPHGRAGCPARCRTCPSCSRRCSARSRPQLAAERGLEHGGWATVITARTAIEARVMVTERVPPLHGRREQVLHQVGLPYHWGSRGIDRATRPTTCSRSSWTPTSTSASARPRRCDIRPGRGARAAGAAGARRGVPRRGGPGCGPRGRGAVVSTHDPAALAGWEEHPPRVGFFTDTSVCIGCKACEVACKEWNQVPEDGLDLTGHSYDNTGGLGARHLAPRGLHRAPSLAQPLCRQSTTASAGS